jgi:hypothetical protein
MTNDQRFLKAMNIDPKDIDFPPVPRPIPQESVLRLNEVEAVDGMALMPMSTFNALLRYASSLEFKACTSQTAVDSAANWCKEAQELNATMRRWRAAFLVVWAAFLALGAWTLVKR